MCMSVAFHQGMWPAVTFTCSHLTDSLSGYHYLYRHFYLHLCSLGIEITDLGVLTTLLFQLGYRNTDGINVSGWSLDIQTETHLLSLSHLSHLSQPSAPGLLLVAVCPRGCYGRPPTPPRAWASTPCCLNGWRAPTALRPPSCSRLWSAWRPVQPGPSLARLPRSHSSAWQLMDGESVCVCESVFVSVCACA